MDETKEAERWQPVVAGERYRALDALRGLAMFGVLLVNLHSDFRVPLAEDIIHPQAGNGPGDVAVSLLIKSLLEFKAFAVFSLLFGVGLAIFQERAERRGVNGVVFLLRRLLVLLGIGLTHLLVIWNGDILTLYAVCGLLLLPLLRLPTPALVGLGVAGLLCQYLGVFDRVYPPDATFQRLAVEAGPIYRTGGFVETLAFHLKETGQMIIPLLAGSAPKTWGLMALGAAASRAGVVSDPQRHRRLLLTVAFVVGGFGGAVTALSVWATVTGQPLPVPARVAEFAYLPLALGYAAVGLLWLSHPRVRSGPFAAAGQMALSNYLASSVVFSLIFYGYGLALCGKLGSAPAATIGVLVYAAEVGFSAWWLRRYRFGPVEWLWRSLTYGTRQPLRGE